MDDSCWNCKHAVIIDGEFWECAEGIDKEDCDACDKWEEYREPFNIWEDIAIEEKYREKRGY